MCTPKAPKVQPIPERQASRLPDSGDPAVREAMRRRRTALRAMVAPAMGTPSTSTLGVG